MNSRRQKTEIQQFEELAGPLRNIYWRIRATRSVNKRRKWYRQAAKEKARLAGLGYDTEAIRLYAYFLKNPRIEVRYARFERFFEELQNRPPSPPDPVQLTFF